MCAPERRRKTQQRLRRSSSCALLCAQTQRGARGNCAVPRSDPRAPRGKVSRYPTGEDALQTGLGSFSCTGAISRARRDVWETSRGGSDFHRRGRWGARFRAGRTQRASGAESSGFLPRARRFPHSAEPGEPRALRRGRCAPQAAEGRVSALTP